MFLKSLELWGFKSFADRTFLHFEKGLSSIVGPNGSGKSNIGDALLWVFGEQSIKSLRGGKMEDVIFSGSSNKNPSNIAKVALYIDNKDREIDLDVDEVVVERKLYRSGDSEYRINGRLVRLKDVYQLFMDTGVGRSGYSIVSQGKISEIVSLRAEDRRGIFEDASGISKYKYKKKESEKTLLKTQENLNRIMDIKKEVDNRIAPLLKESTKAKEFIELSKSKREIEVSILLHNLKSLENELKENIDYSDMLENQVFELQSKINGLESKTEEIFNLMNQLTIKSSELSRQNELIDEETQKTKSSIAVLENNILHNEERIKVINSDIEEINEKKLDLKKELQDLSLKISKIELDISEKEAFINDLNNSFELEFKDYNIKDSQKTNIEANINKLTYEFFSLKSKISSNEFKLSENKEEVLNLNEDILNLQKYILNADNQVNEIKNIIEVKSKDFDIKNQTLKSLILQRDTINKNVNEKEVIVNNLKSQIMHLQNQITSDENLKENVEGFYLSVKSVIKAQKAGQLDGLRGTIADLLTINKKYVNCIEVALLNSMQFIVTDDYNASKNAIDFLKNKKLGRATFLSLSDIKETKPLDSLIFKESGVVGSAFDLVEYSSEYKDVFKYLLLKILVVEDIDKAIYIGKKYGMKFKIVTIDGQVLNSGGSLTGGSKIKSNGIISRVSRIKDFEIQLKYKTDELKKITSSYDDQKSRLYNLNEDINLKTKENKELELEVISLNSKLDMLLYKRSNLDNDLNVKKSFIKSIDDRNTKLESDIKKDIDCIGKIDEELNSLKIKLDLFSIDQKDILKKKDDKLSKINDNKIFLNSLQKDLENSISFSYNINSQILSYDSNINSLKDEILALNLKTEDFSKQITFLDNQNKEKLDVKSNNKSLIDKIMADKNALEVQSIDIRKSLKSLNEDKEKQIVKLTSFRENYKNKEVDYDDMISFLWDEYLITRTDAEKEFPEVKDIEGFNEKLLKIKLKIKNMGHINVSSIEEYEEVKQRHDFLEKQVSDIIKSKSEIKRVIKNLTKEMESKFKNSFDMINSSFKHTFSKLFEGGTGTLSLTDVDNVLESGIEINISLLGKNVKNISLLSGGEKSFVAIAVYFSIFCIRPSSFCVLDEIEAALDEVNVVRFAKYIKELSLNTQFVVVTHRRGTMEESDILYGVTMKEDGISKIIKMDYKG